VPGRARRSADGRTSESKGCQPSLGTERQGPGCAPRGWAIHLGCNQRPAGGRDRRPIGGTASRTDEGHRRSLSWRGDGGGSLRCQPNQCRSMGRGTNSRFPPQSWTTTDCGTCSGRRKPSRVWSISNCKIEGISRGKAAAAQDLPVSCL